MIRTVRSLLAAASAVLLSAGLATAGDITVENAKARVIVPTNPAAAYFTIKNAGAADKLVGVSTPAFARAELHTHKMEGDVARMLKIEALEVPAKGEAALKSGGDHVMLFEAAKPLKVGDSFPLTLTFEKAGAVEIEVTVAPLKETMDHSAHGKGHEGHHGGHHNAGDKKMDHSGHGGHHQGH